MKKGTKLLFVLTLGLQSYNVSAQSVFEKDIQSNANHGDIENRDILISSINSSNHLINTGYYHYNQGQSSATIHATLSDHNNDGTSQFIYDYIALDSDSNELNTELYSVAEYNGGYILVGTVTDNSYHSSSVTGGGDLFILKCNSSGGVVSHKIIDLGGNDKGNAIKQMGSSSNFVICGESSYTDGTGTGIVLKIDNNLNISWCREFDIRLSASTATINPFNDLVYDGSDIWVVGDARNVPNSDFVGLVLKINTSGTLTAARRLGNVLTNMHINHVENDGSNLIMTGNQQQKSFFGGTTDRMYALKYAKSTHTIVKDLKLGSDQNVGYDIIKSGIGGSSNYYVVGRRKPSSGSNTGILYILDNTFKATKELHYANTYDTEVYAIDTGAVDTCSYLAMCGLDGVSSSYNRGYFIKSSHVGVTGCEDTTSLDTANLSLFVSTITDSVDTNYSTFSKSVIKDTLVDSLLCDDTLSNCTAGTHRLMLEDDKDFQHKNGNLFPNPVGRGEILHLTSNYESTFRYLKLLNAVGQVVLESTPLNNRVDLSTANLKPGIYFIHYEFDDGNAKVVKFIVQ